MKDTIEHGANAVDELFHYGKKGMRWGVTTKVESSRARATDARARADRRSGKLGNGADQRKAKKLERKADAIGDRADRRAAKKLDKLDKKWQKEMANGGAYMKMYNSAANKMNDSEIDRINNKPEHVKARDAGKFNDWMHPSPELKAYEKDMEDTFNAHMIDAGRKLGSSPSGKLKFVVKDVPDPDNEGQTYQDVFMVDTTKETVRHAENDPAFRVVLNDDGSVESFGDAAELTHYGVKGMKWGVTNVDRAAEVTVSQKKPGTYAKAKGGAHLPLHDDAVTALTAKQKAKRSTTDALSNDELRKANERLQLEANFNKLVNSADRRSRGAKFVSGLFKIKRDPKVDPDVRSGEEIRKAVDEILAARAGANQE